MICLQLQFDVKLRLVLVKCYLWC